MNYYEEESDVPIKYRHNPLDLSKVKTAKQVINDKVKVEITRYNNEDAEVLLNTIREFKDMVDTSDLYNKESGKEFLTGFQDVSQETPWIPGPQ